MEKLVILVHGYDAIIIATINFGDNPVRSGFIHSNFTLLIISASPHYTINYYSIKNPHILHQTVKPST